LAEREETKFTKKRADEKTKSVRASRREMEKAVGRRTI